MRLRPSGILAFSGLPLPRIGHSIGWATQFGEPLLFAMRWLMIGLLVSLLALLLAAAGVARHVLMQRANLRRKQAASIEQTHDPALDPADETDQEP